MINPGISAILLALIASNAFAGDPNLSPDLQSLQDRWAEANYRVDQTHKLATFEQLAADTDALLSLHPQDAQLLVWQGIILSTWAGAKGGIGALSLTKQAKVSLEQAIEIDPDVLAGSAWTSLGSLYDQVPGWPIGFGNDKKAREYLEKGLALNPDGVDSNYFFAVYLLDEGEWAEATRYLEKALSAPQRPGRELADAGRHTEVVAKLADARSNLN